METPPLNIRLETLDDSEPWSVEQRMFDILMEYFDSSSGVSPAAAAEAIDSLAPTKRTPGQGEQLESIESFLSILWGDFLIIARQIDHDHVAQDLLIDLMLELDKLPPVEIIILEVGIGNSRHVSTEDALLTTFVLSRIVCCFGAASQC